MGHCQRQVSKMTPPVTPHQLAAHVTQELGGGGENGISPSEER